jgi:hypothetical protein
MNRSPELDFALTMRIPRFAKSTCDHSSDQSSGWPSPPNRARSSVRASRFSLELEELVDQVLFNSDVSRQHISDEAVRELVFLVERANHLGFPDDEHGSRRNRGRCRHANELARKATFPKKNHPVPESPRRLLCRNCPVLNSTRRLARRPYPDAELQQSQEVKELQENSVHRILRYRAKPSELRMRRILPPPCVGGCPKVYRRTPKTAIFMRRRIK